MLRQSHMVSASSHIAIKSLGLAVLLALFAVLTLPTEAGAKKKDKKERPTNGRIEVSTNPGGYPILIDGQPSGETSSTVRLIDLPPGKHTVEIDFPNGTRWVRDFNIASNRKQCITINFTPRTITIERPVKSPCPYPVNVSAPAVVNDGEVITFAADVAYGGPSALNYTWTVSPPAARITGGAGTPTLTVDSTGLGRQRVTAILVVDDGSGDHNCRQTAQASTNVNAPPPPPVQPRKFDEFPSISFDDDKARLDNFAIELQNNPSAQGYIIVYGGRRNSADFADRLGARSRNYLVTVRGMDANRIVVRNGGLRDRPTIELWIVPQGAPLPQPTPGFFQPQSTSPVRRRRRP